MITDPTYIIFYIVAAISFVCSVYVTASILKFGSDAPSTKLVLFIHITLLIEDISSLPYVFNYNDNLCKIMGFIHIYSGLANVVVVGSMMVTYRYLFIEDTWHICAFIVKWANYLVFAFPLITLLPFITDSFGEEDGNTWCGLGNKNDIARIWIICVFYGWILIILISSSASLINTIWTVYKADPEMALKLFNSIGLYATITILSWIPRGISKIKMIDTFQSVWGYYFIYFSGFFYFLVFLSEKRSLQLLEINNLSERKSGAPKESFSWEIDSVESGSRFTMSDRMQSQSADRMHSGAKMSTTSAMSATSTSSVDYIKNPIPSLKEDLLPNQL